VIKALRAPNAAGVYTIVAKS